MKRLILTGGLIFGLAACEQMGGVNLGGAGAAPGAPGAGGGFTEFLVLGSSMSFEECRARGGIIIRDQGSPMVACDPRVRRAPVPADEFDHPGSPVPQTDQTAAG